MPAGIGRPYNKDERIIGEAKKRLRNAPKNKSIQDREGGAIRGNIMGLSEPSNAPGEGYRAVSRDTDNQVARNMTRGGLSPDERSKYAK
jgi:hypothetical protein